MASITRRLLLLAVAVILFVPQAFSQVQVSTTLFYGSPYIWRGEVLSNGYVLQPTVSAGMGGFALTFFGSIDPKSPYLHEEKLHFQEADLTASYATAFDKVALGVGYTLYTFPTPDDGSLELNPTHEVYASAGLTGVPLSPSLFAAYDFKTFEGLYAEAKVAQELTIAEHPYTLGAALGIDSAYLLPDSETGISHLALTAGTAFDAGSLSFSPLVGFQISIDDVYKDAFGDNFFYGGLAVTF